MEFNLTDTKTITLSDLIAHRFRGFARRENSIEGLKAALDFGVKVIEFDVRVAKCGTPMVYHDEHAKAARGRKLHLADYCASEYDGLGGDFPHFPRLEDVLQIAAMHENRDAKLLIDIKDAGFEREIHALVNLYRLTDRVVYVSWVPESLYAIYDLDPTAPLCLSHWCKRPGPHVRSVHKVFTAKNGEIPRPDRKYVHGERSGWYVNGPLRGQLRNMIAKTKGYVCVPQDMVSADLVADYHKDGIRVSTFSYTDMAKANAHKERFNIDLYFIDSLSVFEAIASS